jgi:hypothetical protein
MGKNSFADFISAVKRLARKAGKGLVIALRVLLAIFGLCYFVVGNLVVLGTSPVWMPLAFIFKPAWLARKINKTLSDDPWEFFMEVRLASVATIGRFFQWLGLRSWCTRKQRFAFLEEFTPGLKDYPVKVQVQYWEDCSYKENNFKCLSEKARVTILEKLLWDGMYGIILNHMNACNTSEKGEILCSLISALQVRESQEEKMAIFKLIAQNYSAKDFNLSMMKSEDVEFLWNSLSSMKLLVLFTRGMRIELLKRLIMNENMPEGEGRKILERYIENKTLNSSQISYLIKMAEEYDDAGYILAKIIIKHGLTPQLLSQVYETKNPGFIGDIVDTLAIFTDRQMIKGVAGADLTYSAKVYENEQRWKKYCGVREISPIAQIEMSYDQYRVFKASGQRLCAEALEWMVINLSDKLYFEQVIADEYDNITDKLKSLIMTVDWKAAILVDMTAKKIQA